VFFQSFWTCCCLSLHVCLISVLHAMPLVFCLWKESACGGVLFAPTTGMPTEHKIMSTYIFPNKTTRKGKREMLSQITAQM